MNDILKVGESLHAGQQLLSADGLKRLVMQYDGNLVIYTPRGARWDTGTWQLPAATRPTHLDLQTDGNIVLYNDHGFVGWSPNVYGKGGTRLVMQDDENLVLYRDDNTAVWDSHTAVPPAPAGEIKAYKQAEVAWAKHTEVWATLYRNGTLVVNSKSRCDAPFSGYRPTTFIVAIDNQGRVVWASHALVGKTLCALFDPTCGSSGTDTFTEQWPSEVAQIVVRLDVYPSDGGIYDKWREQIKEAGELYDDLKKYFVNF